MINLTVVEDNVTITVSEVGPTGPAGQGVPTGGTAGQVLTKLSGTNYDTAWTTNGAGTVTSVGLSAPIGFSVTGSPVTSNGTLSLSFNPDYSLPSNASQANWNTAYTNRISNLTNNGSNGSATLINNVLNVPNYNIAGLGGVPTTRTLTINSITYDLSSDRSWTIPAGVSSVNASSPLSSSGGTTPNITIQQSSTSQSGFLSSTDWNIFNDKVSQTRTIATSGPLQGGGNLSANRTLSITQADTSTDGYLSSTDWNTFNNKVESSRQITATAPLTGGGNLSSNVTVGITAASSLTDGYITASDYVDFKNGIKQLGSQTVGYFTKYSGDKAIAQSSVYEDGTTLFLPSIVKQSGLGNSKAVVTDGSGNTVSATIGTGLSLVGGVLTATGTGTGSIGGTGTINYVPKFSGTSSIGNSNIQDSGSLITLGSNSAVSGSLGIGQSALTGYNLRIGSNITGATTSYGIFNSSTIQSDVTTTAIYNRTVASTQAASFNLTNIYHYFASQGTFGAGSSVTTQIGFFADNGLIGATTNIGFYGLIPSGTNRWNLFMSGTAANYLAGDTGIGSSPNFVSSGPILTTTLTNGGSGYVDGTYTDVASSNISGSLNADYALFTIVVSGGIVTTATLTWGGTSYRAGDTLTVSNTLLGGTGSGLVITINTVDSSQLTIASLDGGDITLFRNDTSLAVGENIGTIKWGGRDSSAKASGLYAEIGAFAAGSSGGAYLSFFTSTGAGGALTEQLRIGNGGQVGIGGAYSLTGYSLRVSKNITGAVNSFGIASDGAIQSGVTTSANLFYTSATTAATTFTLASLNHFAAVQGTFGAGSTVTNQYGFIVGATLIGATNNYGFYGNIASGTNRWNLYMNGTANNYMAGSLGIGSATLTGYSLKVNKNMTGASTSYGLTSEGAIQSDVTVNARLFYTNPSTQATAFTLTNLSHYIADQSTFGAGSTVTNQYGFQVFASLVGATNNYGFRGAIPSGSNRFNLYMDGTAQNYFNGNTGLGTLPTTTAELSLGAGTTAQAQINLASSTAPTSPVNGDIWFDGTSLKIRIGGVTRTFTVA